MSGMSGHGGATANLVLGRGGVRGIAIAGAVCALQAAGYRFPRVAGISAGAVVAALVAAGYSHHELRRMVWGLDFSGLRDSSGFGRVPVVGPAWRLATRSGVYDGDALLHLMRGFLAAKGVVTFGDLPPAPDGGPRLQLLAADVTRRRMVVLPDDARQYDVDPDDLEVALAVRMSTSLPLLFQPIRFGPAGVRSLIVDGGVLLGLPFGLFDSARDSHRPTFAIQAGPGALRRSARPVRGPLSLVAASYYTALSAAEDVYRSDSERERTIDVECGLIAATRFRLRDDQKQQLYEAGVTAADRFLAQATVARAVVPGEARPRLRVLP
jgi:NTE family protein